jgi:hypothetical protein
VANLMVIASFALRISSLRSECGLKPAGGAREPCWWSCASWSSVLADWQSDGLRVYLAMLMQTVGSAWLAWAAADIWRHFRLRVARAMAWPLPH